MKKNTLIACTAAAFLAFGSTMAYADSEPPEVTSMGSLVVTGTIEPSISLTVESGEAELTDAGEADASFDLQSIAKYGVEDPAGFEIARGEEDWSLSSTIGIKVLKANMPTSSDFTLKAVLASNPATGVTWSLNEIELGDSEVEVDGEAGYTDTNTYAWVIAITDDAEPESIGNTINFTAVAN